MKKVYIALNKYNLGVAECVAISEDAYVFGVKSSPIFGNGAIPALIDLEEEYFEQFQSVCGDHEVVYIRDFNYPSEYELVLNKYNSL